MAKQVYNGPPARMKKQNTSGYYDGILHGWYHVFVKPGELTPHPQYNFYQRTPPVNENGGIFTPYSTKACCLFWNGGRWVVWVRNLFIAEPTEFMDINDPPLEWAEGVYRLTNA